VRSAGGLIWKIFFPEAQRRQELWDTKRDHCMYMCNSVQECVWLSVGASYVLTTLMTHHWNVLLCFSATEDYEQSTCVVSVCFDKCLSGVS